MESLASAYERAGQGEMVLRIYEQLLDLRRNTLGPDHPGNLGMLNTLARAHLESGDLHQAIPLFEQALTLTDGQAGFESLESLGNLGSVYRDAGEMEKAIPVLERLLDEGKAVLGSEHSFVLHGAESLARAYLLAGDVENARRLCESSLEAMRRKLGTKDGSTLSCMSVLAVAYYDTGERDKSLSIGEQAVELSKQGAGIEDPFIHLVLEKWAILLLREGRFDDSLSVIQSVLASQRIGNATATYDKGMLASMHFLRAEALNSLSRWTEAEASAREAISILAEAQPGKWGVFKAKSVLGESLLGQGKLDDAESLLLEGYNGLKEREAKLPAAERERLIGAAVKRLVRLYEASGKSEETAKWRQVLEEHESKARQASEAP